MMPLVIIGIVSLVVGIAFILDKKALDKFINSLNKVIIKTKPVGEKESMVLGVFLIIFSVVLFVIAKRYWR